MSIVIHRNEPWEHAWVLYPGFVPGPDNAPAVAVTFRAWGPDEDIINTGVGNGMVLLMNGDHLDAVVAIGYPAGLPLGEFQYEVRATEPNGRVLVDESGTLTVTDAPSGGPARTVRPWDLLNPNMGHTPEEVRAERLAICHACDRLHLGVCGECHCVMRLKVTLADAVCPLGKWGAFNA